MQLSRRRFIVLMAGLPGIAACSLGHSKSDRQVDEDQLGNDLLATLTDLSSAKTIGRRYFESLKQKPARRMVAQVLANRLSPNRGAVMKLDKAALRSQIYRQCREDYLTGQTVELRGWLLPRTEVELCLLAVL